MYRDHQVTQFLVQVRSGLHRYTRVSVGLLNLRKRLWVWNILTSHLYGKIFVGSWLIWGRGMFGSKSLCGCVHATLLSPGISFFTNTFGSKHSCVHAIFPSVVRMITEMPEKGVFWVLILPKPASLVLHEHEKVCSHDCVTPFLGGACMHCAGCARESGSRHRLGSTLYTAHWQNFESR